MEAPTRLGPDLIAVLAAPTTKALHPASQHRTSNARLTAAAANTDHDAEKVMQELTRHRPWNKLGEPCQ